MTAEPKNMDAEQIKSELNRIEGMIVANRGDGELRFWKWLQIVCSIAITILLPWGVWATNRIYSLSESQARIQEWQAQGPRFTPADGVRLKLESKEELRNEVGTKIDTLTGKVDAVRSDMSELKYQLMIHMNKEDTRP